LAKVDHKNCMQLRGLCIAEPIMMVTQLMRYGSVISYLQKNRSQVNEKMLLIWSQQIAEGMEYLETRKIVHRDLAARNILVKDLYHVKIADFGLARVIQSHEHCFKAVTRSLVPIKWLAIESIRERSFTHQSDVWSYGVCLWEIFTLCQYKPYAEITEPIELLPKLIKGVRLAQPQMASLDTYLILLKCWLESPISRPTFKELNEEFNKMIRHPKTYLDIQVIIQIFSYKIEFTLINFDDI
jgi:serine/threonine protein kinase